jgi:hypothetical protein
MLQQNGSTGSKTNRSHDGKALRPISKPLTSSSVTVVTRRAIVARLRGQ